VSLCKEKCPHTTWPGTGGGQKKHYQLYFDFWWGPKEGCVGHKLHPGEEVLSLEDNNLPSHVSLGFTNTNPSSLFLFLFSIFLRPRDSSQSISMDDLSNKKRKRPTTTTAAGPNLEEEARRYVDGVAALLESDPPRSIAGLPAAEGKREASAKMLRVLLADDSAWPAPATPLRDHLRSHLDFFASLLATKYKFSQFSSSQSLISISHLNLNL